MITGRTKTFDKIQKITLLALMTALVVVLQLFARFFTIGIFAINASLVAIVIGAAMLGPMAGGWLGLVSAVTIIASGDAAPFWAVSVIGTIVTVVAKGVLSGFVSGVVYKLFQKKNSLVSIIVSSLICPIVNTGVFTLLGFVFFFSKFNEEAAGGNVLIFFIVNYIGWNFLFEIISTGILSPVIHRIVLVGKKMLSGKANHE